MRCNIAPIISISSTWLTQVRAGPVYPVAVDIGRDIPIQLTQPVGDPESIYSNYHNNAHYHHQQYETQRSGVDGASDTKIRLDNANLSQLIDRVESETLVTKNLLSTLGYSDRKTVITEWYSDMMDVANQIETLDLEKGALLSMWIEDTHTKMDGANNFWRFDASKIIEPLLRFESHVSHMDQPKNTMTMNEVVHSNIVDLISTHDQARRLLGDRLPTMELSSVVNDIHNVLLAENSSRDFESLQGAGEKATKAIGYLTDYVTQMVDELEIDWRDQLSTLGGVIKSASAIGWNGAKEVKRQVEEGIESPTGQKLVGAARHGVEVGLTKLDVFVNNALDRLLDALDADESDEEIQKLTAEWDLANEKLKEHARLVSGDKDTQGLRDIWSWIKGLFLGGSRSDRVETILRRMDETAKLMDGEVGNLRDQLQVSREGMSMLEMIADHGFFSKYLSYVLESLRNKQYIHTSRMKLYLAQMADLLIELEREYEMAAPRTTAVPSDVVSGTEDDEIPEKSKFSQFDDLDDETPSTLPKSGDDGLVLQALNVLEAAIEHATISICSLSKTSDSGTPDREHYDIDQTTDSEDEVNADRVSIGVGSALRVVRESSRKIIEKIHALDETYQESSSPIIADMETVFRQYIANIVDFILNPKNNGTKSLSEDVLTGICSLSRSTRDRLIPLVAQLKDRVESQLDDDEWVSSSHSILDSLEDFFEKLDRFYDAMIVYGDDRSLDDDLMKAAKKLGDGVIELREKLVISTKHLGQHLTEYIRDLSNELLVVTREVIDSIIEITNNEDIKLDASVIESMAKSSYYSYVDLVSGLLSRLGIKIDTNHQRLLIEVSNVNRLRSEIADSIIPLTDLNLPWDNFSFSSPFYRAVNHLPNYFQTIQQMPPLDRGVHPQSGQREKFVTPNFAPGFYGYSNINLSGNQYQFGQYVVPGNDFQHIMTTLDTEKFNQMPYQY